jgi:hypothetical protein
MARRSRMSIVKRQRELKKTERAAQKRAKRHGIIQEGFTEPIPTGRAALGLAPEPDDDVSGDPLDDPSGETDEP